MRFITMSDNERRHLFVLVLLALFLRLYVLLTTSVVGTDSYNFFHEARSFAEGRYYEALQHPWHPLFPFLYGLLSRLTGEYEISGKGVSLVLGTLSLFPLYFLTRSVFNHRVAVFACLLLAINPTHIRLSADIMADPTHIFFFLSGAWLTWEVIYSRAYKWTPLVIIAAFLSYMARAEGVGLLFMAVVWLSYTWVLDAERPLRQRVGYIALMGILAVVLFLPYLYFIRERTGGWHISQQAISLQITGEREVPRPEIGYELGPRGEREPEASRLVRWKEAGEYHKIFLLVCHEFIKDFYQPLFVFFLIGFFRVVVPERRHGGERGFRGGVVSALRACGSVIGAVRLRMASSEKRGEYFLLTFLSIYFPIFCLFAYQSYYISGRYVLPVTILSFGWAGVGVEVVSEYLCELRPLLRKDVSGGFSYAGLVLALVLLVVTLPKDLKIKRKEEVIKKEAGHWVKTHFPGKNPVIMGLVGMDLQKVAFYAQGEFVWLPLPLGDYPSVLGWAETNRIHYLIFCKEELQSRVPEVLENIETSGDFVFLQEWTSSRGERKHLKIYGCKERRDG